MRHAVIFDIDGTLLDSSDVDEALFKRAICEILGDVDFRAGLGEYDHVTDTGILQEILADNRLAADSGTTDEIKACFFELLENHVASVGPFAEVPGARTILQQVKASPWHGIAIATGCWRRSAEIKLGSAGFDISGIPLATSDDAIGRTDIMRIALEAIGSACHPVTYFGDGPWDRRACGELGWRFRAVGPALKGLASFDLAFASLQGQDPVPGLSAQD